MTSTAQFAGGEVLEVRNSFRGRAAFGIVVAVLSLGGRDARADAETYATAVTNELSLGGTKASATNPRSTFAGEKLGFAYKIPAPWSFRFDGTYTRDFATPAPTGSSYAGSGGNVWLLTPIVAWLPNEHWAVVAQGDFSPASTTLTSTSLSLTGLAGVTRDIDTQISARSSSMGGSITSTYESGGESTFEWAALLSAAVTSFDTTQLISGLSAKDGRAVTPAQVVDYCKTHKCPRPFAPLLDAQAVAVTQARFGAAFTGTLFSKTDVALAFTYYLYSRDPLETGYFSVASLGRSSAKFGAGVAVAPVQFTLAPEITQKFGRFQLTASFLYGRYIEDQGHSLAIGLKPQVRFGESFLLWVALGVQRDVDVDAVVSTSGLATLGAKLLF